MEKCAHCGKDAIDTCQHCDKKICPDCQFKCGAQVDEGGGYYVDCWWTVCVKCKDKHHLC